MDGARRSLHPPARIVFDVTNHPTRLHVVEALRGKSGYLTLTRLVIDSYEREEYLLFSGFDDGGASLDQETMEKLFACAGRVDGGEPHPGSRAAAPGRRSRAPRQGHHQPVAGAEQRPLQPGAREAGEVGRRHGALGREGAARTPRSRSRRCAAQARQAATLEEQHAIQEKIQKLERQQRRQRQEIFKVEDEIMEKRDSLIDSLEKRLAQRTETETLFTIRWQSCDRAAIRMNTERDAR